MWGAGPRVRIYCVFDDDAITGDDVSEDPLLKSPTDGDWKMSIPCLPEDVTWSTSRLASASTRITARAVDEDVDDEEATSKTDAPQLTVNVAEFLKP